MRNIVITTLVLSATTSMPAFAGGFGLLANGGMHAAPAYYYAPSGAQGVDNQFRPNVGYGAEILIGDSDDRILGVMRAYINNDWPTTAPNVTIEDAAIPPADEQDIRFDGIITIGAQWGIWGEPLGFQLIATSMIGCAAATIDNLEYLIAEGGIGVTYNLSEQMQLASTIAVAGRYRKSLSHAESGFVSVRYLFD